MPMDESRRVFVRHRNAGAQDVADFTLKPPLLQLYGIQLNRNRCQIQPKSKTH